MASITVDIEARVKGYQEAIEKLRAEFAKIDPGSQIGKSISRALTQADSQVKNLSKNMFPKASSDNQIDAITDKVNRAGESIMHVSQLMQQVGASDLNLSALGVDVENFRSQIAALQTDLETKLGQGLLNAVSNSNELKSVFQDILGIDLSKAKGTELFDQLAKGALHAAQEVEKAEKAVNQAQTNLDKNVQVREAIDNSPFGSIAGKQQLQDQVSGFQKDYEAAFSKLKISLQEGLSKTLQGDPNLQKKLLNEFLEGLNPSNIRDKINTLASELKNSGAISKQTGLREIYSQIFGIDEKGSTWKNVANLVDFDKVNAIKEQFRNLVQQFTSELTRPEAMRLTELINSDSLEEAANKTVQDIDKAFTKIQNQYQKRMQEMPHLEEVLAQAHINLQTAQATQSNITGANTDLQAKYEQLLTQYQQQQEQITRLQQQLDALTQQKAQQISQTGAGAGQLAAGQMFPIEEANKYKTAVEQVRSAEQMVGKIQGVVQRWFSVYAVVRMVGKAIRSVISTVQELDKTITEIAIVTNMTQGDLWGQMEQYTQTARQYATSIAGVYKVSQLYYQQGLQQADVMALTEQTLKMARISGLEYATATDYMTNAVRSFKMEMTEASTVVDVYSAIAASSATSVTELASAMSKTASSAQAVGSSFQNTTAMMAVMIEATRESAENIGSAMKSIISRYGEMTSDPSKLMDSEGEEMSLNRVDKALQTVGISIHDAAGQFRDFDEVIMELAEKWNTIDKNTQRYIATIMAGNRQQSRFLALVSSYDRLKELSQTAADSEDASQLQFLKTLDSVEAKSQQLQTSLQSLYVGSGIEKMYKNILDITNNIIKTFTEMPKLFNLPIPAISKIGLQFISIANVVTTTFGLIKQKLAIQIKAMSGDTITNAQQTSNQRQNIAKQEADARIREMERVRQAALATENEITQATEQQAIRRYRSTKYAAQHGTVPSAPGRYKGSRSNGSGGISRGWGWGGMAFSAAGSAISLYADSMDTKKDRTGKGVLTGLGTAAQLTGIGATMGGGWGALIGGIIGTVIGAFQAFGIINQTVTERVKELNEDLEASNNKVKQSAADLKTLTDYQKKYKELQAERYLDNEHEQEWINLNNEIVQNYPELLSYIDAEGNAVADLEAAYDNLLNKKKEAYEESMLENMQANIKAFTDMQYVMNDQVQATLKIMGPAQLQALGTNVDFGAISSNLSTGYDILQIAAGTWPVTAITQSPLFPSLNIGNLGRGEETNRNDWTGTANEILNTITAAMTVAKQDKDAFKKILTAQGINWEELVGGNSTAPSRELNSGLYNLIRKRVTGQPGEIDTMPADIYQTIVNFAQSVEKNYQEYFDQASKRIELQLKNVSDYYSAGLDLSQYAFLKDRANKAVMTQWETVLSDASDPVEAFTKFWNQIPNIVEGVNDEVFSSGQYASEEILSQAENLFTKKTQQSVDTLINIEQSFDEAILSLFDQQQLDDLINYGKKQKDKIKLRNQAIVDHALKTSTIDKKDAEFYNGVAEQLNNYLFAIPIEYAEAYSKQFETIITSEAYLPEKKSTILDQILKTQNEILTGNYTDEIKKAATTILSSADYTSLGSLIETQKKLKNLGINIDFSSLINNIIPNIETELQTFAKKITNNMSDFEKAISSATKGMDFKAATEMAQKLGKRITDFDFKEGKYYFNNLSLIQQKYLSDDEEYIKILQQKISQQNKAYELDKEFLDSYAHTGEKFETIISSEGKKAFYEEYGINVSSIISQRKEFLKAYSEGRAQNFSQWLIDQNTEEAQAAISAAEAYTDYQINAAYLTSGNLDAFVKGAAEAKNKQQAREYANQVAKQKIEEVRKNNQEIDLTYALKNKSREIMENIGSQLAAIESEKEFLDSSVYSRKFEYKLTQDTKQDFYEQKGLDIRNILLEREKFLQAPIEEQNKGFSTWLSKTIIDKNGLQEILMNMVKKQFPELSSDELKQKVSELLQKNITEESITEEDFNKFYEEAYEEYYEGHKEELEEELQEELTNKIATGDTTDLPPYLQKYAKLIYDTFHSVQTSVVNSLFTAVRGGQQNIFVNGINKGILKQFVDEGYFEADKNDWADEGHTELKEDTELQVNIKKFKESNETDWNNFVRGLNATNEEKLKFMSDYYAIKYPDLSSSIDKDTLSISEFQNIIIGLEGQDEALKWDEKLGEYGLELNIFTGQLERVDETLITKLEDKLTTVEENSELYKKYQAQLESAKRTQTYKSATKIRSALSNVLKNYKEFDEQTYEALQESLSSEDFDIIQKYITDHRDGTFSLQGNLNQLLNIEGITNSTKNVLRELIAGIADDYLAAISTATDYVAKGTTKQADMQKFVDDYNNKFNTQLKIGDLFKWEDTLDAFTLKPEYLQGYIEAQKVELVKQGFDPAIVEQFITNQIDQLRAAVDFSSFFQSENRAKSRATLKNQMIATFEANKGEEERNIAQALLGPEYSEENFQKIRDAVIDKDIAILEAGGTAAVSVLKQYKPDATSEEIEQAYRLYINDLQSLGELLPNLQIGSIVDENTVSRLKQLGLTGFTADENGVITAVGDMVAAYQAIYDAMTEAAGRTTSDVNKAYAQLRTAQEQGDIDAIAAMGDAMGMTYEALGEILAKRGKDLETWLKDNSNLYQSIGAGKIRLTDFTSFAAQMGWKPGSEEYTSAFKAYNDSLIEMNSQAKKSIEDEIKGLQDVKGGDQLNLTELYTELQKQIITIPKMGNVYEVQNPLKELQVELSKYSASLVNGILTLDKDTNLIGVVQALTTAAEKAGIELSAEIQDMIQNIIKAYAEAITNGIKGTLDNAGREDLINKAASLGITDLQFTQTTEGFKLAQSSAIQLYGTIRQIDAMQGKLVFDELNQSLQESNEHYKGISDIMNRIQWLSAQIKSTDGTVSNARKQQYAEELALAEQILAVRSTTEDASFNFMSNKIPSGQNNPINYYNNWIKAWKTLTDAFENQGTYNKRDSKTGELLQEQVKSGFVDYQDWYNIVNELNNIARLGGQIEISGTKLDGSLTAAAELIQKGAASLVATDTGEIKVALSGMELNFEEGADAFSGGVDKGIRALAKGQINMLDGMIQLLETVVAMEKLGDITGDNDTIDITDLFPDINWKEGEKRVIDNQQALQWINNELLKAPENSEIGKFISNAKLNGQNLREMLHNAVTAGEGVTEENAKALSSLMNSLWQMYQSGEYNLDDLYSSIQQIANTSNLDLVVPMGDTTVHVKHGAVIVESKDDKGNTKFTTPSGGSYDTFEEAAARSALAAYHAEDITYEQHIATGKIKFTLDGKQVEVDVKSNAKGEVNFTDGTNSYTDWNQYVREVILKGEQDTTVINQKSIEIGLQLGTVKLNSTSYKAIDSEIRQELESAFAAGDTIKIQQFVETTPVLKQLKGKSIEEIAQTLGIVTETQIINVNAETQNANNALDETKKKAEEIDALTPSIDVTVNDSTKSGVDSVLAELNRIPSRKNVLVQAKGNIGMATGNAQAKGTLMGELGPELVVQNGRYFVVGQNGAEFVDLQSDAIVFNHLQTQQLLKNGMSSSRGRAVTNERVATAYAKGNVNGGQAMASASAALNALKQLRAEWQALAGFSVSDLAGKGGGGGGGGGDKELAGFIRDVERWYNWLQKIADLEKQINYEEQLRSKIQSDAASNGRAYYDSQIRQLNQLNDSIATSSSLYLSQKEYFEQRRNQLNNNSPLSELYTFDESGQLHYQEGSYQWLANLFKTNDYGALELTPQQQYEMILKRNPQFAQYMKYNSEGKEIKEKDYKENKDQYYLDMVKAFSDRMDSEKDEMQNLFDSINEQGNAVNEKLQQQNELIQAMKDNQKEVEEAVLKAIEESRQRQIDDAQKERDAYSESTDRYIEGLNKALADEQKMYQNQESKDEVDKLRRQLAILQRSGGSASQISSLQKEIQEKDRDLYFDQYQQQIDAVKEASDLQLERLDHQIELMEETLAYEKEHGLLWEQVYEVMAKTPEEISSFIQENTAEEWAKSPLSSTEGANDWIFKTEQWTSFRDDIHGIYDSLNAAWNIFDESMNEMFGSDWENLDKETEAALYRQFTKVYQETGDYNKAAEAIQKSDTYQTLKKKKDDEAIASLQTQEEESGTVQSSKNVPYPVGKKSDWQYDAEKHWKNVKYSDGSIRKVDQGKHKYAGAITNTSRCTICNRPVTQYSPTASANSSKTITTTSKQETKEPTLLEAVGQGIYNSALSWLRGYDNGGLIDYTGPAMVHGTPQKPEGMLNAEQLDILRNNILSKKNPLISAIADFQTLLDNTASATINNNSSPVVIENATVAMNVQQLANDYDARRAGESALEEIMKIARKTGAQGVARR